jgi:hypothetical protein
LSIKEVEDSDDIDALPRIVGMAETPPNKTVNLNRAKSKFWHSDGMQQEFVGRSSRTVSKKITYWAKELVETQCTSVEGILAKPRYLRRRRREQSSGFAIHDKAMLYLQTQLCHETLRSWLDRRNARAKGISVLENERIFRQILQGVQHIHAQGTCNKENSSTIIIL